MQASWLMHVRFVLAAVAACLGPQILATPNEQGKAEHIVVVVWDGMRPDFVTPRDAPTLAALARDGVLFQNHHSTFPPSTNVNGAVLATGDYPQKNGLIANQEFRAEVDPQKPFDTSDFPALDAADGKINADWLAVPTIVELIQQAGFRTAIAGSKPVAQLFDRCRRREREAARDSVVIYRGKFLPPFAAGAVTSVIGSPPKRHGFPNEEEDNWTTRALTEVLWKDGLPKFSLLWLSEPDLSQHETAPGSPTALAAIKNCDQNLARVLAALKAKNALTTTDIFVVSDHGFSTINLSLDAAERLRAAGFDAVRSFSAPPRPGQVLAVTLGGGMEFYVAGHDPAVVRHLVDFLQHSDFAGVIFTRQEHPGTFTLAQGRIETAGAPDVFVTARWNDRPNEFGVPGEAASDVGKGLGQGTHTTLSPFDLHNMLIAAGPDFRRGWKDDIPTGNIDLAPTILALLGLPIPESTDGRVLAEALRKPGTLPHISTDELRAERHLDHSAWNQTLRLTTVGKTVYFTEGNGGPKQPNE